MPKISDKIRVFHRRSTVEQICEIEPRHTMVSYVMIEVESPVVTIEQYQAEIEGERPRPVLKIKACPLCFAQWMRDLSDVLKDFNT